MNFLELAKTRYSCRKFSDRSIEPEKLEKIFEAAMAAPTAVNKQPWKIWAIQTSEALEKVRSITPFHFDAPVILALGGDARQAWTRSYDRRNFEDVDAAIVGAHVLLEVQDLGLGATWVAVFDAPKMKELFPEMAEHDLIALFPIGYPADDAKPSEQHGKRKAESESIIHI